MSDLSVNDNWNKDIDESQKKNKMDWEEKNTRSQSESIQTFNSWIEMDELTKDAQKKAVERKTRTEVGGHD